MLDKKKLHGKNVKEENVEFQMLFGYSFEERYKKWQNMDYLPINKYDSPKFTLFDRYLNNTPRMLKAADIWSVGAVVFGLLCASYPFQSGNEKPADVLEAIVTRKWPLPLKDTRYDTPLPAELKTSPVRVSFIYTIL